MERKKAPQLIAVIALVSFLFLAYGFDALTTYLRSQVFTFFTLILWVYALSRLLVAAAFLWLFWYLMTKIPKGWFLPALFVILGLLVVLSPILYFTPIWSALRVSPTSLIFANPTSLFFTAGGLSIASGILAFILQKQQLPKDSQ